MKALRSCLAAFLVGLACTIVGGQVSAPDTIDIRDEGTSQGRVRAIDFVGTGVTAAVAGGTATVTVSGGSGSANVTEKSIDLGTSGGLVFTATVTGQAWVTSSSDIVCQPFATSADGQTIETYAAAALETTAGNRVAGVGFDVQVFSPHGATGIFRVHCTGA